MSSNIDIDNASAAGQRDNTPSEGLTFGIELEFVALIPKKIAEKHENVPNYVRNLLSKARVARPCDNLNARRKSTNSSYPSREVSKEYIRTTSGTWMSTVL